MRKNKFNLFKTPGLRKISYLKNKIFKLVYKQNPGVKSYNSIKAFTLVELIIVITILAILATIGFVSFQSYTKSTRDSNRLATIRNISNGLEVFFAKTNTFPKPTNYISISLTGTGTELNYQGYVGDDVSNLIGMSKTPSDPQNSQNLYIYSTNKDGKSYQVLTYLEDSSSLSYNLNLNKAQAEDRSNKTITTQGRGVGILLDNVTNEEIRSNVELFGAQSGSIYKVSVPGVQITSGSGVELGGQIQSLSKGSGNYEAPITCPTGFIKVPGNKEFSQPGFCVAKYEMTYRNLTQLPTHTSWNMYGLLTENPTCTRFVSGTGNGESCTPQNFSNQNGGIASKPGYPIANITQHEAIQACKSMGDGYHLITNNEWMTIARNIESNSLNWSGGVIGTTLFNGISGDINIGCSMTGSYFGKFGVPSTDTNCKRRIQILNNGEEIWDLAGNAFEHVNKSNTLDGSNYNLGKTKILDNNYPVGLSGGANEFYDFNNVGWTSSGISDYYKKIYGPGKSNYNHINNGVGNLQGYRTSDSTWPENALVRGGSDNLNLNSGVYSISFIFGTRTSGPSTGFRCAYY